jgi:hypothetical protein
MKRKNPNNPFILMVALGLCLGVLIVSANDADQTFRNGKLISFKDLSLEFSSNNPTGDAPYAVDSAHGMNLVSALNVISRFIGAADSFSSEDISLIDAGLNEVSNGKPLGSSTDSTERGSGIRKALSSRVNIDNFARASL